jgi:hypothetical protein
MSNNNKLTMTDLYGMQFILKKTWSTLPVGSIIGVNPLGGSITFNGGMVPPDAYLHLSQLLLKEVNDGFNYLQPVNQIKNKV